MDYFGVMIGTTLRVVWGHFEGNLGVLWVVPWGHFEGTLGVTLGVLWDYFEGTLSVVLDYYKYPSGSLWGYIGFLLRALWGILKVPWGHFGVTPGML